MARPHHGLEDFLDYTSTPEWRSAILSAALSFAAFHLVALMTPPLSLDASGALTGSLGLPLFHLAAEMLRFCLPMACLAHGISGYRRRLKAVIARR
jgi:hypothetical protein